MVDIPLGKAIAPVEVSKPTAGSCHECFYSIATNNCRTSNIACHSWQRKDGKNVVFKLLDYPAKGEK
jgi:hypothetical protein